MKARALALVLLCSCSYTYKQAGGQSRGVATATFAADLGGVIGGLFVTDQAFDIDDAPQRWAVMGTAFVGAALYALSAKSVTRPTRRKVTAAECVDEWQRLNSATTLDDRPGAPQDDGYQYRRWGTLPCDMDRMQRPGENW